MGCSRAEAIFMFRGSAQEFCGNLLAVVESWKRKPIYEPWETRHRITETLKSGFFSHNPVSASG